MKFRHGILVILAGVVIAILMFGVSPIMAPQFENQSLEPTSVPVLTWHLADSQIDAMGTQIVGNFGGQPRETLRVNSFWDGNGNFTYAYRVNRGLPLWHLDQFQDGNVTGLAHLLLTGAMTYGRDSYPYSGVYAGSGLSVHPPEGGMLVLEFVLPLDGDYNLDLEFFRYLDIAGIVEVEVLDTQAVSIFREEVAAQSTVELHAEISAQAGSSFFVTIDQGFLDSFSGDALLISGNITYQ